LKSSLYLVFETKVQETMKLFNDLVLKFEHPDWSKNPEFGLIDTIFELHPELYLILKDDIVKGEKESVFGRKDTPTVEQIVRAAFYKEMKGLDYRELEYAQSDSRICSNFIKLDMRKPFSFQMFQKYISKIKVSSLSKMMVAINKIAIDSGYEDVERIRQDSTVVESNIHYPTNNSLVWDCIKESHRLLKQLKEEIESVPFIDYTKTAKSTYFKINNTKPEDKKIALFHKQLITFTKVINQTSNAIKKKSGSIVAMALKMRLKELLPLMEQVFDITYRKEIALESVPNDQKIFSIYEQHTNIIVKGSREVEFGHKVNLATGKNLIIDCEVLYGNPSDKTLYQPTINRIIENYNKIPRDSVSDGGYASKENSLFSEEKGIINIVFNKVVGSLQNIATSINMATRLKKWRSGIEATISNLKRGFHLSRCYWKGWEHFCSKVLWSVLAYNFRVLTNMTLSRISVLV
jgi:IS5 family transposase